MTAAKVVGVGSSRNPSLPLTNQLKGTILSNYFKLWSLIDHL